MRARFGWPLLTPSSCSRCDQVGPRIRKKTNENVAQRQGYLKVIDCTARSAERTRWRP